MSRGYEARRKWKRRQLDEAPARTNEGKRRASFRSLAVPIALIAIAPVCATFGILSSGSGHGPSQQVSRQVDALLAGIPQSGAMLGSPQAPLTLRVFADLECPDVKTFVLLNLPSIINTWVRNGVLKLEYRSLQTDTTDPSTFARQEIASLAAGRQDKLWNFALTLVYEQRDGYINYASEELLANVASQVPGLRRKRWRNDRKDPHLMTQVAISDSLGTAEGLLTTPTFLIGPTNGEITQVVGSRVAPSFVDAAALNRYVNSVDRQ